MQGGEEMMQKLLSVKYVAAEKIALRNLREQLVVQWEKWGMQRHTFEEWAAILNKELAEFNYKVIATKKEDGYEELRHCAAVCVAWMIDVLLTQGEASK